MHNPHDVLHDAALRDDLHAKAVDAAVDPFEQQLDLACRLSPELDLEEMRPYFAVLFQVAPTIAALSLVAGSWLRSIAKTRYVGPGEIEALAKAENAMMRTRTYARTIRNAKAWENLLVPFPNGHLRPGLEALRLEARGSVVKWMDAVIEGEVQLDGRDGHED